MDHGHHVAPDAIAVTRGLAGDNHLHAHGIGIASNKAVVPMHLPKGTAHPVNGHLPKLAMHGLGQGLIR